MFFQLASFANRRKLAKHLNAKELISEAVEIGTHRGEYAKAFLDIWNGNKLYCVDPWCVPPGYEEQAEEMKQFWGDHTRDEDYQATQAALAQHLRIGRVELIRMTSVLAAPDFCDNSLDFVYIDGDHRYLSVLTDLQTWYPKVKTGGILAGHDAIVPKDADGRWSPCIQKALQDYLGIYKIPVYLIPESSGLPWSWYLEKP